MSTKIWGIKWKERHLDNYMRDETLPGYGIPFVSNWLSGDKTRERKRLWARAYIPTECNYGFMHGVISDWWRHHAYVHCRSARCSPQVPQWNTEQDSKLPYLFQNWKPGAKLFPWRQLQSTILIGQVDIRSWGQLKCRRVPRPFLHCVKSLVPRLCVTCTDMVLWCYHLTIV